MRSYYYIYIDGEKLPKRFEQLEKAMDEARMHKDRDKSATVRVRYDERVWEVN